MLGIKTIVAGYWYENIQHIGISPRITNGKDWVVFRNIKEYGAKGDGITATQLIAHLSRPARDLRDQRSSLELTQDILAS
jgi:hypothetical protein